MRQGSAPYFCPPTEEGITLTLTDEQGDEVVLEFLGLLNLDAQSFGFFFPIDDDNPALSSGEVVILEVVETNDDGQPESFELVEDEDVALKAYEEFKVATKDLYQFS